jgi:hypothetical protein
METTDHPVGLSNHPPPERRGPWGTVDEWTTQAAYACLAVLADHPQRERAPPSDHEAGGAPRRILCASRQLPLSRHSAGRLIDGSRLLLGAGWVLECCRSGGGLPSHVTVRRQRRKSDSCPHGPAGRPPGGTPRSRARQEMRHRHRPAAGWICMMDMHIAPGNSWFAMVSEELTLRSLPARFS